MYVIDREHRYTYESVVHLQETPFCVMWLLQVRQHAGESSRYVRTMRSCLEYV